MRDGHENGDREGKDEGREGDQLPVKHSRLTHVRRQTQAKRRQGERGDRVCALNERMGYSVER